MSIVEHDDELVKAIEFKNNNPMFNGDSDNIDSSDEEEGKESETEVAYYPEIPVQGAKRRKFVKWNGWYDREILSYIEVTNTVNVQLSNGDEEQFTLDE